MKSCPHCGASLPEEASFCPHCAKSVNDRQEPQPPRRISRRPLYAALLALAATGVILLAVFLIRGRPQVYDNSSAEVLYGGWQLCIAWPNTPNEPAYERYVDSPVSEDTRRYAVVLYANRADTGAQAGEEFFALVDSMAVQVDGPSSDLTMICNQPVHRPDYMPGSAAVIYVDYCSSVPGQQTAELTLSLKLKNGDELRLHQIQRIIFREIHDFTPEDAPMDTVADLEALLDQIGQTLDPADPVNIHLPAVTYTGAFTVEGRPVNFYGSTDESGHRTTFTAPVRVDMERDVILIWEGIDFAGPGTGTGLSLSARVHLKDCRVAGWDTGVLAHTRAWFNADGSTFEDNGTGLHFNAQEGAPSDTLYEENLFRANGTAVLLEQMPNRTALKFPGTRFEGNGTDIDNRCGQELDLEETEFE